MKRFLIALSIVLIVYILASFVVQWMNTLPQFQ